MVGTVSGRNCQWLVLSVVGTNCQCQCQRNLELLSRYLGGDDFEKKKEQKSKLSRRF